MIFNALKSFFFDRLASLRKSYARMVHSAAHGRELTTTSFQKNAGDVLKTAGFITAARLRARVDRPEIVIPDRPTVNRIIDANPWLAEHARIAHKLIDHRVEDLTASELKYLEQRAGIIINNPRVVSVRLEMLYRNVLGQVINDAEQIELSNEHVGTHFPYAEYLTRHDPRVRHTHNLMHGFVALRSWEGWSIIRPKNGFNCRCYLIYRTWSQAVDRGWADAPGKPKWEVKWPSAAAKANYESGVFPDPGWHGPKLLSDY